MADFVKVAKTTELQDGSMKAVEIDGNMILVANIGGNFYAVDETCPHAQGPLSDGFIEGNEVECPWHGSRFDLRTGEVKVSPAREGLTRYEVRIEGDDIFVKLTS